MGSNDIVLVQRRSPQGLNSNFLSMVLVGGSRNDVAFVNMAR